MIHGGQELSAYPSLCRLSIERRILSGDSVEEVETETQDLINAIELEDTTFKAFARMVFARQPLDVPKNDLLVKVLSWQFVRLMGREPKLTGIVG